MVGTYVCVCKNKKASTMYIVIRIFRRVQNIRLSFLNIIILLQLLLYGIINSWYIFFYAHTVAPVLNTARSLRFTTVWNRSLSRICAYIILQTHTIIYTLYIHNNNDVVYYAFRRRVCFRCFFVFFCFSFWPT